MKLGIVSDLHGNLPALDAVLMDMPAQAVDVLVCLGDVAAFGPQPGEVLERLRGLRTHHSPGVHFVMGNTDAWLLEPWPLESRDANTQKITEVEMWAARQLSGADRAFIHAFQPAVEIALSRGQSLLCFHGSPGSFSDVIVTTTPEDEMGRMLAGRTATVMAGGHTHAQMLRRYGEAIVINPGSVGLRISRAGRRERCTIRAGPSTPFSTSRAGA